MRTKTYDFDGPERYRRFDFAVILVASLVGLDAPTAAEILHLEIKDRYVVGDKIGVWPIFSLSENGYPFFGRRQIPAA